MTRPCIVMCAWRCASPSLPSLSRRLASVSSELHSSLVQGVTSLTCKFVHGGLSPNSLVVSGRSAHSLFYSGNQRCKFVGLLHVTRNLHHNLTNIIASPVQPSNISTCTVVVFMQPKCENTMCPLRTPKRGSQELWLTFPVMISTR